MFRCCEAEDEVWKFAKDDFSEMYTNILVYCCNDAMLPLGYDQTAGKLVDLDLYAEYMHQEKTLGWALLDTDGATRNQVRPFIDEKVHVGRITVRAAKAGLIQSVPKFAAIYGETFAFGDQGHKEILELSEGKLLKAHGVPREDAERFVEWAIGHNKAGMQTKMESAASNAMRVVDEALAGGQIEYTAVQISVMVKPLPAACQGLVRCFIPFLQAFGLDGNGEINQSTTLVEQTAKVKQVKQCLDMVKQAKGSEAAIACITVSRLNDIAACLDNALVLLGQQVVNNTAALLPGLEKQVKGLAKVLDKIDFANEAPMLQCMRSSAGATYPWRCIYSAALPHLHSTPGPPLL